MRLAFRLYGYLCICLDIQPNFLLRPDILNNKATMIVRQHVYKTVRVPNICVFGLLQVFLPDKPAECTADLPFNFVLPLLTQIFYTSRKMPLDLIFLTC